MKQVADHLLHEVHDLILIHEGGFNIKLGEFRLAVGAQILVAKTTHHLVITVHTRNHQQLLVQLRRLGEGKKGILMGAARH